MGIRLQHGARDRARVDKPAIQTQLTLRAVVGYGQPSGCFGCTIEAKRGFCATLTVADRSWHKDVPWFAVNELPRCPPRRRRSTGAPFPCAPSLRIPLRA